MLIDQLARDLPAHVDRLSSARAAVSEPVVWYRHDTLGNVLHLDRLLTGELRDLDALCGGLPVADLGAGDGDLALTLEHAAGWEVDVIDSAQTNQNALRGARLLKDQLGSAVEVHDIDLDGRFELPRERYGAVLMLGLLYHLQNPFYVLRHLAGRSRHLIMSTRVARLAGPNRVDIGDLPVSYLLDPEELAGDATNFWIFTPAGLARIVRRAGWRVLSQLELGNTKSSTPDLVERDERIFMLLESDVR